MDLQQIGQRDPLCLERQLDDGLHRGDVAEDLDGDAIGRLATLGESGLRLDQSSWSGIESLDLRGGDRLSSQEESGETLKADMARPGLVQVPGRSLSVRDVRCQIAGQGEIPSGERIRQVGVIAVALPVMYLI